MGSLMRRDEKISRGILESILPLLKIFVGGLIGFICGYLRIYPLIGLGLWIISIAFIVIVFRFILNFEDHPLKLILLNGTFTSFITFIFIWAILLGP